MRSAPARWTRGKRGESSENWGAETKRKGDRALEDWATNVGNRWVPVGRVGFRPLGPSPQ